MIRKEQQRFSLRKYKVGVASVFLGTTLSFMLANGGAVKASELPTQPNSEEKTELVKKDDSKDSSKKEQNVATAELAEGNKAKEATPAVIEAKPATEETAKVEESAKPEVAEGEANKAENTEESKPAATESKPATDESNKPKVRNRRATTEDAVSGDHNTKPVSVSTYLKVYLQCEFLLL